ncbi:MAG: hypothetical protein U0931_05350 [Vulcanimicrobiota bacterium]
MRRGLVVLALTGLALGQPAGLVATECVLYRTPLVNDRDLSDLRGHLRLRNDSGLAWKEARVVVHLMDGYGAPLFNYEIPALKSWAAGEQKDFPVYQPGYAGSVWIFKLGAEVRATSEGKPVHFEVPPQEASSGTSTPVNY